MELPIYFDWYADHFFYGEIGRGNFNTRNSGHLTNYLHKKLSQSARFFEPTTQDRDRQHN